MTSEQSPTDFAAATSFIAAVASWLREGNMSTQSTARLTMWEPASSRWGIWLRSKWERE